MSVTINDISFVTTALATAGVIGICVYGLVRCAKYWRLFTGIALLLLIPLWFFFQLLGAASLSFFIIFGVRFVVVGVSLLMDVRIWRN